MRPCLQIAVNTQTHSQGPIQKGNLRRKTNLNKNSSTSSAPQRRLRTGCSPPPHSKARAGGRVGGRKGGRAWGRAGRRVGGREGGREGGTDGGREGGAAGGAVCGGLLCFAPPAHTHTHTRTHARTIACITDLGPPVAWYWRWWFD